MTLEPAIPRDGPVQGGDQILFTPGPRLGWTFRSHRDLIGTYPEPAPDAEAISNDAGQRLAAARRSWQRAGKWVLRPSLIVLVGLLALGGFAHALNRGSPFGTTVIAAVILAAPGTGWALWRLAQLSMAKSVDPRRQYELARAGWEERAAVWDRDQLEQVAGIPEWGSAASPSLHTDVFGGVVDGWRSLLAVHGASIMADRPLLVADLTGQDATAVLAATAQGAGVPVAKYLLPRDLGVSGLLAMLPSRQLADALAEAIHAGSPDAARTDRAIDTRVLDQLATALAGHGVTFTRLAAAVQAALGRTVPPGLLTEQETSLIGGPMFGDDYRSQIGANLVRLDAFLSDLARYAGSGPTNIPPPAWCTVLSTEPGAGSFRSEVISALIIQWLTVQITASTGEHTPAIIIAGANGITTHHIERLAAACEQRAVPLTVLFGHLRNDALQLIGGTTATAFMRLGNHQEAEQAASFIGRHHRFVLSGYTATKGAEHSTSRGTSQTRGSGEARGFNHRGLASLGDSVRSRDYSRSYSYGVEESESDGTSWNNATDTSRVYEYAVEPTVLQALPDNALLLINRNASGSLLSIECDPTIVSLPSVSAYPVGPRSEPPRTQPEPVDASLAPQDEAW
jgi:hypothetical protein